MTEKCHICGRDADWSVTEDPIQIRIGPLEISWKGDKEPICKRHVDELTDG